MIHPSTGVNSHDTTPRHDDSHHVPPRDGDDAPAALMLATLLSALGVALLFSPRKKVTDNSGSR